MRIFQLMDRAPEIGIAGGDEMTDWIPEIELRGVCFRYPSRPDALVLKNVGGLHLVCLCVCLCVSVSVCVCVFLTHTHPFMCPLQATFHVPTGSVVALVGPSGGGEDMQLLCCSLPLGKES